MPRRKIIYRPGVEFTPPKGISTDACFLYGPKKWQDETGEALKSIPGIHLLMSDAVDYCWDVTSYCRAELGLFYLKGSVCPSVLSHLISPGWHQYPTETYVYMTPQCSELDEICLLCENTGERFFKIVDKPETLVKMAVKAFDYLKGTAVCQNS